MRILVAALVVAVVSVAPAGAQDVTAAGDAPARRVWAHLSDGVTLTAFQRESLKAEVDEVWRALDVAVSWTADPPEPDGSDRDLYVSVLVDQRPPSAGVVEGDGTLGAVMYVPASGAFRLTVYASPPLTRALLRQTAPFLSAMMLDRLLGRALGRIVAHEIGHLLLASRVHAPDGLMKASFGVHDLLSETRDNLTLPPAFVARLAQPAQAHAADADR